jgi:hypothetical protein
MKHLKECIMKLHQLIAILNTVKDKATKEQTAVYQMAQKPLFKGLRRVYTPEDDNGFVYPPESQSIQIKAKDLVDRYITASWEAVNLCAAQDASNREAKADVIVDNIVVLANVPVTTLLYLEKNLLKDLRTFVASLPVLDPDKEWIYSESQGCYITPSRVTVKTKKITKAVVLYEATKEHPAQVKEASEDIVEGKWSTFDQSSAYPASQVAALVSRVEKFTQAVVIAREAANSQDVVNNNIASEIFSHIFGG